MSRSKSTGRPSQRGARRKRDYKAEYARRKAIGLAAGKSLSVVRGHAKAGERSAPVPRGKPTLADPLERAAQLMRGGESLRKAAKALRVSEERLRRHVRETANASFANGVWTFDRSMAIATNGRVRWIVVGPSSATEIGRYWRALSEFLLHGEDDPHPLKRFIGMGVRDTHGRFWPFETGLNTLSRLDTIGELTGLELYRIAPSED